jgi:hydroxyethylthiazole kinase-like uncharacterized protein yjeF
VNRRRVSTIDPGWVAEQLPARPDDAHKGTFGRLLVVAGSPEYSGAALLVGLGAMRAGAGLVCLAAPESVLGRLVGVVPELTMLPLPEEAPGLAGPGGWRKLSAELAGYDAMVIGPGLGRQVMVLRRVRSLLAGVSRPVVVDADGLNALAELDRWWRPLRVPHILTPHPLEFARLRRDPAVGEAAAGDDAARGALAIDAAALWQQIVVLKGARTVIAAPDGRVARSDVATPALATAGSGDVLAGVIGGLLAQGAGPTEAALWGVYTHALAGEAAARDLGDDGMVASDLLSRLPNVLRDLRRRSERS